MGGGLAQIARERNWAWLRPGLRDGQLPEPRTVRGGKLVVSRAGLKRWGLDIPEFERGPVEVVPYVIHMRA